VSPLPVEGPEGTALGGCVKVYVPPPAGRWGLVLRLGRDAAARPNPDPDLTRGFGPPGER
jgi:hypothetical protein